MELRSTASPRPSLAAFCACLLLAACAQPPPPAPSEKWPTSGWTFSAPEAQGIDSYALTDAIETIRARRLPIHSLFLERNGYAVLDVYFFPFAADETHDLASVTKSVISTLVGIAQSEHLLGSLDQPVSSFFPDEPLADPRKRQITLSNLLSMTSGLDCSAPRGVDLVREMEHSSDWIAFTLGLPQGAQPGAAFEYCAGNMHLVSAALTKTIGENASGFGRRELFTPIGIAHTDWPADPQGNSYGFANLEMEPRDAAKLGYLWLHHGLWEGRQVVPADYLATALTPHANVQQGIQYGYGFWIYPRHTPFDFEANGRGGQRITVIPSENLVAVMTAGGTDANFIAPLIAGAIKSNFPLPPNPVGDARLADAASGAARPPPAFAPSPVPAWARAIAGTNYVVGDNPFGLRTLSLTLGPGNDASIRLGFVDAANADHPIGLDGVPRLSIDPATGHRVALLGRWRSGGLDLDYDEVARIDDYHLRIVSVAGGLSIHVLQRTGPLDVMLTATRG